MAPTIAIPPVEEATPEQRAYFEAVMRRMGFTGVSWITRAMAMKLDLATAYSKGTGLVMGDSGVLPGWFKGMLAVATSAVYSCDY
jgi:hypothetical protein